ncbi:MAG: sigma-54-dependent transcriptional regulator, partial [Isosphaeraceae bacterium]
DVLEAELQKRGFETTTTTSPEDGLRRLVEDDFGLVLTDINMHGMTGVEVCRQIVESREDLPVVVMTAFGSMEAAIATIRAGAYDFVTKPFEMDDIALTIERALKHRALREEVKRLRRVVVDQQRFDDILGTSSAMKKMYDLLARVAETETTVLITGESGTGKELVAKALHNNSPRRYKPFVTLNCAALSDNILESELFGHVKGAFTGADRERKGWFEHANGGTLFLDEVGDIPLGTQVKLLRALESGEIVRVGTNEPIKVNVRLISATNRDLTDAINAGEFRQDLYHRLKVVSVKLPPLRERREDMDLLIDHFLKEFTTAHDRKISSITPAVRKLLRQYSWPGNVRELKNVIESMVVIDTDGVLDVDDLTEDIQAATITTPGEQRPAATDSLLGKPLEAIEKHFIIETLKLCGGNREEAARILGIGERTLYRKLKEYGSS